jgi:hypothetical protein
LAPKWQFHSPQAPRDVMVSKALTMIKRSLPALVFFDAPDR